MRTKVFFLCAVAWCCSPWCTAPMALAAGIVIGIGGLNPWRASTPVWTRELLKWSIVGLGFGMEFHTVLQTGRSSFVYTGLGIAACMCAGLLLGRVFRVPFNAAFLISAGTSICGGSAIAATRSIIEASDEDTAISLTTVFVLNSLALMLFPLAGAAAGLTQQQFGLWAALAIHDTSSVVGAGLKYGPVALTVGTTVKLVRALWIVPFSVLVAAFFRSRGKKSWPWFIALFLAAAWLHSDWPQVAVVSRGIARAAQAGFCATLFLIGAGLSREALVRVGWRPFVQGVALWMLTAVTSFLFIRNGWIGL